MPVTGGENPSRLSALWKALSHYSEATCSVVSSVSLSQTHFQVHEPVLVTVYLQFPWDLLFSYSPMGASFGHVRVLGMTAYKSRLGITLPVERYK